MTLRLALNNSSPKFGILTNFCSEMLKVRKSTKNDFNWKVDISQSTAVKASKFPVTLSLDLSNSSWKFGILTLLRSKRVKVGKTTKNDLKWMANISETTVVEVSKFLVVLSFDFNSFSSKFSFCSSWDINPWIKVRFCFFSNLSKPFAAQVSNFGKTLLSSRTAGKTPNFARVLLNICTSHNQSFNVVGCFVLELL